MRRAEDNWLYAAPVRLGLDSCSVQCSMYYCSYQLFHDNNASSPLLLFCARGLAVYVSVLCSRFRVTDFVSVLTGEILLLH